MNKTAQFLGDASCWHRFQMMLQDVQMLFGGVRVSIRGDGYMAVETIGRGGQTDSFVEKSVSFEQIVQLCQLCIEVDFVACKVPERMGLPDESRPLIQLTNADGNVYACSKWAGVSYYPFDAVYEGIQALI